jgi:transposase-like protein
MSYSPERKEAVIKQMMPPHNKSISELSQKEGISSATLFKWRNQARYAGQVLPDAQRQGDAWSTRDKFNAVVQCAALSQVEVAQYCRERGLYVEQIEQWRESCEKANDWQRQSTAQIRQAERAAKDQIKQLERELTRKEKALAETAALLVLRKKAQAIWGEPEGE